MTYASDLMGAVVCTESGEKLGRVHDLRAVFRDGAWRLMGLVVGGGGIRARLGGGARDEDSLSASDVIAWEAITRLEEGRITVRDEVALTIP
jgi:sporulation protein YlmC with PRC-barrel domain